MFKPTHVTRAVYRAYGIEHPIGDPFGGPAYGQKEKGGIGGIFQSAIPIIAGAAMMIGSGGALAPMVIGGAMLAGGAMSGIGAITGNNTLSKIGGITSAVAGVAGMGYGVYQNWDSISGFFANGTELAGAGSESIALQSGESITDALTRAQAAGNTAVQGGAAAAEMAAAPTTAAFQGGSYTDQLAGELGNQIQATQAPVAQSLQANMAPSNMLASAQGTTDVGGVGSSLGKVGLDTGFGTAQPFVGTPAPLPGSAASFGSSGGATIGDTGGFVSSQLAGGEGGGLLSSVGNFIEKNPLASMIGFQAASGLAQGASPKSQAEGEYLQAQADYLNAKQEWEQAAQQAALDQTAANTEYLRSKAQEFEKSKAYAEEKRRLYNESIINLQTPQTQNLAQIMQGGAQNTGLLNAARA